MRNPTFLVLSRHGVFYFRYPLSKTLHPSGRPSDVKISLCTREPKEALYLARRLGYLGSALIGAGTIAGMRYDELRKVIQTHFATALAKHKAKVAVEGPLPTDRLASLRWSADYTDQQLTTGVIEDDEGHKSKLAAFVARHALAIEQGTGDYERLSREYLAAERDLLLAMAQHNGDLSSYNFAVPTSAVPAMTAPDAGDTTYHLHEVAARYFADSKREGQWEQKTEDEKNEYLSLLYELLGREVDIREVGTKHAREVKRQLQDIPVNRHKNPLTRGKSLADAMAVPGRPKLHVATINKYLQTYSGLFVWATDHDYVSINPFKKMRMHEKLEDDKPRRSPFSAEQLGVIRAALLNVKDDWAYHKWGALITMYLGARLNEVAQLDLADIRQVDDIWCFDINRNGKFKRLKNPQSKRIVPVHPWLIQHGLLRYVEGVRNRGSSRLFPEYSFTASDGYGRNLGRWFNEGLLVDLKIKAKDLTFHSLRHSMVDRLVKADVSLPHIMAIVGHEPGTTTLKVYNSRGFPPHLLLAALEKIA